MATIAQSGLYPPIIDAYLPAFITDKKVITDGLTIPFDISAYNTVDSTTDGIKTVHDSITCQDDYKSLFNSNYKRGVIINSIVKNDNNYMTTIHNTLLNCGTPISHITSFDELERPCLKETLTGKTRLNHKYDYIIALLIFITRGYIDG